MAGKEVDEGEEIWHRLNRGIFTVLPQMWVAHRTRDMYLVNYDPVG